MKKSREKPVNSTQREAVRRAQETGKRQAYKGARRSYEDTKQSHRFVPDSTPKADVSVPVPNPIRRGFVISIVIVAFGLLLYALVKNVDLGRLLEIPHTLSGVSATSAATDVPPTQRIGIVSGHRGNDSGAVCQDGLTESQVNFDISVRVAGMLRSQGYTVDILDEFDARLKGYYSALLLSIHADSCTYINDLATGYKVARVLDSKIPQAEDRLVGCIRTKYGASTGLHFHQNTVTFDMTKYHAFYEIDERTPAAIIETGFLYMDRTVLTRRQDLVAQGIYDGLLCFINNEPPKTS